MITAKEAKFESENRETINNIMTSLEEAILKSIESGGYIADTTIPSDLSANVQEKLKEELEALGYSVEFPISPKKRGGSKVVVSWMNAKTE